MTFDTVRYSLSVIDMPTKPFGDIPIHDLSDRELLVLVLARQDYLVTRQDDMVKEMEKMNGRVTHNERLIWLAIGACGMTAFLATIGIAVASVIIAM